MKNVLYNIALLTLILFAIGCEKEDDYVAPYGDFSSFQWYSSGGWDSDTKSINVNNYVAFYDLSRNALSHKWITPSSTYFLSREFDQTDSIYTPYIIGGGGQSTEDLINVLFTQPGIHEVRLVNTFKDSVTDATLTDGVWTVDKTFTVDVYADPNPAAEIYYNGNLVFSMNESDQPSIENKSTWPVFEIEAAENLTYVDKSTQGRITGRRWFFEGGKPETSGQDTVVVAYNKLGEFTTTLTSIRNSGNGSTNKSALKYLPIIIKVNPSTKPFVFNGGLNISADGVISFLVTGETNAIIGQKEFFTVHVTNTDANFDADIPVQTVRVNPDDATKIELILADAIFNTDEITVSYAGGTITSVDGRLLEPFGPEDAAVTLGESILDNAWASFENPRLAGNINRKANTEGYWVGSSNDAFQYFWLTDERAIDGTYSMRYLNPNGVDRDMLLQGREFALPDGIPAGKYQISYQVFLAPGNTMKAFTSVLFCCGLSWTWDLATLPRGEWVTISQFVEFTSDVPNVGNDARLDLLISQADNPGVSSGEQRMYFDNLKLIPLNPRI